MADIPEWPIFPAGDQEILKPFIALDEPICILLGYFIIIQLRNPLEDN
jgi:hypothetical protein